MDDMAFYIVKFTRYDEDPSDDPVSDPVYFKNQKAAYKYMMTAQFSKDNDLYGYYMSMSELTVADSDDLPLVQSKPITLDIDKVIELMFTKLNLIDIKDCTEEIEDDKPSSW